MTRRWHEIAGVRVAAAGVAGLVVLAVAVAAGASAAVAVSAGWCALALIVCASEWALIGAMDDVETKRRALAVDFSRQSADLVLVGASLTSLVAVGFTLVQAGRAHGSAKVLLVALVVLTVASAWASVHTVYTVRYADLYYSEPVGGIDFHDDDQPDYIDFAYFALTIGMTFQVSDTDIHARPIRRMVVRHALLSYLFGAVIVGVTINVVASLLSK